ncbi:aldehyde dehydrogenase family protein [Pseudodesulfovibrio sp.]|uniref:aldehyde dehydrogenase family protein n=1 Tax=Pseudodesulfovibrio sp. TaxID=2035812 RepID=UPI0026241E7A|nr:aldehyde dehydrogenase family protein [Pseudodesulfovibrio sp.]MDD3313316.1 aldehyde dehydrogenase family protein [Pseudodesulfovibrio sp.]
MNVPEFVPNLIAGEERPALSGKTFDKCDPCKGTPLFSVARSEAADVAEAVRSARASQPAWGGLPAVRRGMVLHDVVRLMEDRREEIAQVVHRETGKSMKDALGETQAAIQVGLFYASEGQRLYGRTCTTGVPNRFSMTVRQPVGVAGLIIAANTPIANVAWKVFPALVCGNGVVLKGAEDTPATAWLFGRIAREAGLPDGVLNIVQGLGPEAGQPLVEHPDVGVVSFTGSARVGKLLGRIAGERLAKISLELGGKNAFVVCDDADIDSAADWAILSAFSNAGQRCVAGARIIVFESVYEAFKRRFLERTGELRLGSGDGDDFGPVINGRQLANMIASVKKAVDDGATLLTGGDRLKDAAHADGFFMAPTVLENVPPDAPISREELFGPICCLYAVPGFAEALALANDCDYGLSACIHTGNFHRGIAFCQAVETGVAVVNAGTFGSEPHMPFGGTKNSGNGSREPGTEAIDIYSDLKDIYIHTDKGKL